MSAEGFQYRALYEFTKDQEEDLDLQPGDLLTVSKASLLSMESYQDGCIEHPDRLGWLLGFNERTKQRGDFPGTYVEYVGPVRMGHPSSQPRYQRPLPATPRLDASQAVPAPDLSEQFTPPQTAPPALVSLLHAIEKRGLDSKTLYRTGSLAPESPVYSLSTEGEMFQSDVCFLSEGVISYLRELPSPVVPACVYPDLQAALQQQQQLEQAAGMPLALSCTRIGTKHRQSSEACLAPQLSYTLAGLWRKLQTSRFSNGGTTATLKD